MASNVQTASITAQNTFTTAIVTPPVPRGLANKVSVSISGVWVATVTLQRSFDGATFFDVSNFTANAEVIADEPEPNITYRLGVKTGNFTSGTVVLRLAIL